MKRIFLSALIGAGLVALISPVFSESSAPRTLQSYPLVCRGGGSLVIGIAQGERNIGFTFTRGTRPAREGLAPGECSWADRGMYPSEPDRVSQHVEAGYESLKAGGTLAPENRWFEQLHSSDKYWTFMVSNNGRGQLIATGARPNEETVVPPKRSVPPVPEVNPDDPGRRGPGDLRADCGMTLPCGGTVSQGAPAFSIINLGGASIYAQGGGAGLFGSAIRAKNTNAKHPHPNLLMLPERMPRTPPTLPRRRVQASEQFLKTDRPDTESAAPEPGPHAADHRSGAAESRARGTRPASGVT